MLKFLKTTVGIILLITLCGYTSSGPLVVDVDKTKLETGEVFTYSIAVNGEFSEDARITPPDFSPFKIVTQNQSRNYSFHEGKMSFSVTFVYRLIAPEPGTFTIAETVLKDNGKEIKSATFTITVEGRPLKEKEKVLPYINGATDL